MPRHIQRTMLIRVPDDILLRFPDIKLSDIMSIQRAADNAERIVPVSMAANVGPRTATLGTVRRKPGPKPGRRKTKVKAKAAGRKPKKRAVKAPAKRHRKPVAAAAAPSASSAVEEQILDAIGSATMSRAEVATATGLDSEVAARALTAMREKGQIATEGRNRGMRYCAVKRYDHSLPPNGAGSTRDVSAEASGTGAE